MTRAIDDELRRLAATQDGLLTRKQVLEFMDPSTLRRRLAHEWQRPLPGVYAPSRAVLTVRQQKRAALLYGGDNALLADLTVLADIGVADLPATDMTHLLIPAEQHRANAGFVIVRRTHRMPDPVVIAGLPYCPAERALAETAMRLADLQTARALIADGVCQQLAKCSRLGAELPHLAGRGAGIARRAIEDILGGARSAPECEFVDLSQGIRGLPRPLINCLLELPDGRRVSPDALWPEARLIHETNSRRWHAAEDTFESTQERAATLTTAGLVVVGNSPRQIRTEEARIKRQISALYRENVGRGLPPGVRVIREGPLAS